MSDQINIGDLIASVQLDTSKFDRASANVESGLFAIRKQINDLRTDFDAGHVSTQDYAERLAYLTETQNRLIAAINSATATTSNVVSANQKATKSYDQMAGGMARAGMQAGFMLDDVQYGVSGIINNISPLTQSLATAAGASQVMAMGIASGVQIAAVAVYQLYVHWNQFEDALGMGKVRTEAEEMEELGKKTKRTADETERLNKFKHEQSGIKSMMDERPEEERDRAKDIKHAVVEADSRKVVGALAHAMEADGTGEKETLAEASQGNRLRNAMARFSADPEVRAKADERLQAHEDKVKQRINKANVDRAKDLLFQAQDDPLALRSLITKVERNPAAFPAGFLGDLKNQTPEARKQQEEWEAQGRANAKAMPERWKKAEDADKAEKEAAEQADADTIRFSKEARVARENEKRDNLKAAREANPGIDKSAQVVAAGVMMGDISKDEALARIRETLKANDAQYKTELDDAKKTADLDDDKKAEDRANKRADESAKAILGDASGDVAKRAMEGVANPREERIRNVQQFDASQLAAKVQAGVGGENEQKRTNTYLDQAVKILTQIAVANNKNPVAIQFK